MRLGFAPYLLKFKEPSGTSRGVLKEKPTFFIKIYDEKDPEHFGIGEAAVFPGLSPEADGNYVNKLIELMANVALGRQTDLSRHSSILFGFEQAILDFSNGCKGIYYPSSFTRGETEIEINGLIWMGDFDTMLKRIHDKISQGFRCIKLKIGAIDWDNEIKLISIIRKEIGDDVIIRVDANGAFKPCDALKRLYDLAPFNIHSIEQPIKAGNIDGMAELCRQSPVPIALDEELIGKSLESQIDEILIKIKPQYIILKPALCGGISGASLYIKKAENYGIGWWITSALESNIGLNAIAQFAADVNASGPQGLGTGQLFTNNFKAPIKLVSDRLSFDPAETFDYLQFKDLIWHT